MEIWYQIGNVYIQLKNAKSHTSYDCPLCFPTHSWGFIIFWLKWAKRKEIDMSKNGIKLESITKNSIYVGDSSICTRVMDA